MSPRVLPIALLLPTACTTTIDGADDGSTGLQATSSELTARTVVSLTFDDALADQLQAADLLAARGMKGTFYVPTGHLGHSGNLTLAQVLSLQLAGNEIGGHTVDHVDLTTLSQSEMVREVCDDRNALLAAGLSVASFAYPFGADNATAHAVAKDCNYNSARDVGGLVSPGSCSSCSYANPILPANVYQVRTNGSVKTDTTLATLQLYVTQAEQRGGGWVPIVFHHVCNGCNTYSVSATTFESFLTWLDARRSLGTEVATVNEVIGGVVKPPTNGSGSPPPPPTNLLQNASLEIDANGDQVPDCWQRGGFGTNTAAFTRTSTAADGTVAQRIDLTSYTSGARRLVSLQDSGTCAPVARPGHTYTMTAKYIANVSPIFSVYYRSTSGSWVWFAESPRLPPSSAYVSAQYTTPPLPSGATAISIGLSITSVGFLISDAYSLGEN